MGEYRKLRVWKKSHALAIEINLLAANIRGASHAALKTQMIRAAMSVPANLVEGRAQNSEKEFARFIGYALGSAAELDYHLLIAKDIGAIDEAAYQKVESDLTEIRKMMNGLSKKLRLSAKLLIG